ncbi:MAG: GAF domain-containing protein, partial [Verrucomicrobiaceae bacterium]
MPASTPPETPLENPGHCDDLPIRFPGGIQPHGMMFILDHDLNIVGISDNALQHLGRDAEDLLSTPVSDLFSPAARGSVIKSIRLADSGSVNPFPVPMEVTGGILLFDGIAHTTRDGRIILELEPNPGSGDLPDVGLDHHLAVISRSISLTSNIAEISSFSEVMAREMKAVTGYDRVMVYQFCDDFHGHVIAEAMEEGMPPFLGLHYPASDIPAQARELYLTNLMRMACDVDATPIPLICSSGPENAAAVDMSRSVLRCLSPIHLDYLRNMGVRATFSVSLVVDEKLWGLILFHHRSPRFIPYSTRATASLYGTVMATLMEAKRNSSRKDRISAARGQALPLLTGIHDIAGSDGDLFTMLPKLMAFFSASGAIFIS